MASSLSSSATFETDKAKVRTELTRLLRLSNPVYLTTINEQGFPETRAMMNLRNAIMFPKLATFFDSLDKDHAFDLYFATSSALPKNVQLARNHSACAYVCLPEELSGVCIAGSLDTVSDSACKTALWQPEWTRFYFGGFSDPEYTVLRLSPAYMKGYKNAKYFRVTDDELL